MASLLVLLVIAPHPLISAQLVLACNGACWTETSSPASVKLGGGGYSAFAVPFVSGFGNATIGIVFMVVHNYLGQTVQISTATLELPANGNGTAYPVYFGLPPGTYSATFFAVATAGYAFSSSTTVSFAV